MGFDLDWFRVPRFGLGGVTEVGYKVFPLMLKTATEQNC